MIYEIYRWIQLDELVSVQCKRPRKTEQETEPRANGADDETLYKEDVSDRRRLESHRLEDTDLARLVVHHHRQRAHYVERRHDDDQQQDHTHAELLQLECLKQRMVLLLPIDGAIGEAKVVRYRARNDTRVPPVFRTHFEPGYRAVDSGELLRGAKIDVHVRVVVFVHAGLENARHLVAVNARNVRTGRRVLLNTRNGNEIDRVARPHVEA